MSISSFLHFLCTFLILCLAGCRKPVIRSFQVSPLVITGDQKVHIDLHVKGKTSLEFNEHLSSDSIQLLEYTLIATKAGKEARKTIQVQKLKPSALIDIAFATNSLQGDMVVASGENNTTQWNGFQIVSVGASARDLTIVHGGRTALVKANEAFATDFSGTSVAGEWLFRTRLTADEQADSSRIPQQLSIKAFIKPSNH